MAVTDINNNVFSPFGGMNQKIIAAFERISQGLRTLSWNTGKEIQLNPVQIQLIIYLLKHDQQKNTVTQLAKEFNVSKASISDTITALAKKDLVSRLQAGFDSRNVSIVLTSSGRLMAVQADAYANTLLVAMERIPVKDREHLFGTLGDIILALHQAGVFPVQRMCQTCQFHEIKDNAHYCNLLDQQLSVTALQIDCNEHVSLERSGRSQ